MSRVGPRLPRSYLYAPGNRQELVGKAWASGADAVIVDLEDAVPAPEKDVARAAVAEWATQPERDDGPELWVRVNAGADATTDVIALRGARLRGVVLAKATVDDVAELGELLDSLGNDWLVSPLLETPGAVLDAARIARLPRVARLQLGEYDLCAELGIVPGEDERELDGARAQVVLASAAAQVEAPVAPVSIAVHDTRLFLDSTRRTRRQGFFGRACIHPAQLAAVQEVFTPSEDEVSAARATIDLLDRATERGRGTVLDESGRLVDEATIRSARRVLRLTDG